MGKDSRPFLLNPTELYEAFCLLRPAEDFVYGIRAQVALTIAQLVVLVLFYPWIGMCSEGVATATTSSSTGAVQREEGEEGEGEDEANFDAEDSQEEETSLCPAGPASGTAAGNLQADPGRPGPAHLHRSRPGGRFMGQPGAYGVRLARGHAASLGRHHDRKSDHTPAADAELHRAAADLSADLLRMHRPAVREQPVRLQPADGVSGVCEQHPAAAPPADPTSADHAGELGEPVRVATDKHASHAAVGDPSVGEDVDGRGREDARADHAEDPLQLPRGMVRLGDSAQVRRGYAASGEEERARLDGIFARGE
ncbi:hypothetical protein T310_8135 [Rasamsonia emersonii CBS 393.64]|uniref:Uncharacterized protein n=1 Tax=Rasamsonia emersonii (strain ATCC 16479 / CBS 393.64 / IMI 116815) TaxID=1408163 RepID=A0A0F4YI78_RASE3|nr:hypothetical protein T310_8135 [Rasamsonia emersonii CBS 393.64]KKA17924.1 hypothetical protein T310_8135 [Rasamsonia emersonii CBS 393.64]